MKQLTYIIFFGLLSHYACAQRDISHMCNNEAFDAEVNSYLNFSMPVISVKDLKKIEDEVVLLDAREMKEYETSHIKGAKYVGFDKFTTKNIENIDKDKKIVVYCSIGYRSEKIAEKLKKLGYTNVYNLYGSIFEWANEGNTIVNEAGEATKKLHTYNKKWSKWVDNPDIEKVY